MINSLKWKTITYNGAVWKYRFVKEEDNSTHLEAIVTYTKTITELKEEGSTYWAQVNIPIPETLRQYNTPFNTMVGTALSGGYNACWCWDNSSSTTKTTITGWIYTNLNSALNKTARIMLHVYG